VSDWNERGEHCNIKMEAEVLEFLLGHQYIVNDVDATKSSL
jgi:hypothetical protein